MKLINFYTPYPQKRGHSNSHHSRNWQSFNNPSFLLIWHISLVLYFWIVPVLSTMLCMKSFIIWSSSNILHFNLPNYSPRSLLACIFGSDCFHLMYHTPLGLLLNFLLPFSFASFLFLLPLNDVSLRLFLMLVLLVHLLKFSLLVFVM